MNSETWKLETRVIEIDRLVEREENPRVKLAPGMRAYDDLKQSIEDNGYVEPIVWNEQTGRVVGGHQRLTVLRALGAHEVEVVVVRLDDEQERRLGIVLNAVVGEWDYALLADEVDRLEDREHLGFEEWELDAITGGATGAEGHEEPVSGAGGESQPAVIVYVQCADEGQRDLLVEHFNGDANAAAIIDGAALVSELGLTR